LTRRYINLSPVGWVVFKEDVVRLFAVLCWCSTLLEHLFVIGFELRDTRTENATAATRPSNGPFGTHRN